MLCGEFVHAVYVHRSTAMLLVHRKVDRLSINLAGTCINYLYVRIEIAAGFEQGKL